MLQLPGDARLLVEAADAVRLVAQPLVQHLDGDLAAELRVEGAVDDAHATVRHFG